MGLAHCHPTMSFEGKKLSGFSDYQAIENRPYVSVTLYSLWPATAISGNYILQGDFPPGLKCMTPAAPITAIDGTPEPFTTTEVMKSAVGEWDNTFDKIMARSYSAPGSDQGSVTISGENVGTMVSRTYNFTVFCSGMKTAGSSVVPWSASTSATIIVFKDWEADADASMSVMEAIKNGGFRV
ncbi:MAG: hypothetical protein IBX57_00945 [Gammaproteobacteria bacterium]|nr:hypothetical protein [Gammaproteobacteria bacterium]